jgi:hypothetical protein
LDPFRTLVFPCLQVGFYERFKVAHATVKIGLNSFKILKLYFVRKMKDFNTCCCRHHVEMSEITTGFNNMRASHLVTNISLSPCSCECETVCSTPLFGHSVEGPEVCQAKYHVYKRSHELWESCLCPPIELEGTKWYHMKYVQSECFDCRFQLVPLCNKEVDLDSNIRMSWRRFEKVRAGFTKQGEPKFTICLEYNETNPRQFLAYAAPKVRQFLLHNHVYKWQEKQYKNSLNTLREGEISSLVDFAENYTFKGQNEIQSEHWFNWQLTILVHIMYVVNPKYDVNLKQSKCFLTSYFYYISDDRIHDNLFVQNCFAHHWRYITGLDKYPTRHVVWSDGCSAQFKGARS